MKVSCLKVLCKRNLLSLGLFLHRFGDACCHFRPTAPMFPVMARKAFRHYRFPFQNVHQLFFHSLALDLVQELVNYLFVAVNLFIFIHGFLGHVTSAALLVERTTPVTTLVFNCFLVRYSVCLQPSLPVSSSPLKMRPQQCKGVESP